MSVTTITSVTSGVALSNSMRTCQKLIGNYQVDPKPTVAQMQSYANCVNLLHPNNSMKEGFQGILLGTLVCIIIGLILERRKDKWMYKDYPVAALTWGIGGFVFMIFALFIIWVFS